MRLVILAIAVVGLSSSPAKAEQTWREAFKLGSGFSSQGGGYGVHFDVVTPTIFTINSAPGKYRSTVAAFLDVGMLSVFDGTGTIFPFAIGLRSNVLPHDGSLSPYTALALAVVKLDSNIATKSTSLGFLAVFGCDFFYGREVDSLLGTSDLSFFIQGELHLGHRRADSIAGQPRFLDGFVPRVGFRSHF